MTDLKVLGRKCKRLRKSLSKTQSDVANDTGYSFKSISAFENGRANNAIILLWYINHGLEGGVGNGNTKACFNRQVNI